jgi:hypothetical protein
MSRAAMVLSITCGSILLIVILCGVWMYERLAAPSHELHNQLERVVAAHDVREMKSLSNDLSTDQFLMGLPKNAPITVSDLQGGGSPRPGLILGYFPARVGNHTLNCYMVADVSYPHLVPQWHLVKVSTKMVGIDPTWVDAAS